MSRPKICCLLAMLLWCVACSRSSDAEADRAVFQVADTVVVSHLSGRFTVNPEIDPTENYRGFEVLVAANNGGEIDTLGYAITDSTGRFEMGIEAPGRGIYSLIIKRNGVVLKVDDIVVAENDSAMVQAMLPVGDIPLRIRSRENAAWGGYRNTKAQFSADLVEVLSGGAYNDSTATMRVKQTSHILWGMRETFPQTIGGDLAAAEAVTMLENWDDGLLLERALQINPDNFSYVEVAGAARRAQARLGGQQAAVQLVNTFLEAAQTEEQRAGIQALLVQTHVDSLEQEAALAAARTLAASYPDSGWNEWAASMIYELENLMPEMPAPAFSAITRDRTPVSLEDLRGRVVLLEFYAPGNQAFQQEFASRTALYDDLAADPFTIVSFSVQPDSLLNEAFFEGRNFPGTHVFLGSDLDNEIIQAYNLTTIPTRVLIDQEGRLVGKYMGLSYDLIRQTVFAMLGKEDV